jgi:hypothetical protein
MVGRVAQPLMWLVVLAVTSCTRSRDPCPRGKLGDGDRCFADDPNAPEQEEPDAVDTADAGVLPDPGAMVGNLDARSDGAEAGSNVPATDEGGVPDASRFDASVGLDAASDASAADASAADPSAADASDADGAQPDAPNLPSDAASDGDAPPDAAPLPELAAMPTSLPGARFSSRARWSPRSPPASRAIQPARRALAT